MIDNKKKIMIVQKIFAHYRKPVFDELSKFYDLIVVHSIDDSGIKQVKTDYSIEVKKIKLGKDYTRVYLKMLFQMLRFKPDIIIHEFSIGIASLLIVLLISKILKFKVILWSHGYNRKKGFNPERSIGDRLRLFYIGMSNALLLYGDNDKIIFTKYVDKNRIFVAKNTFDTGNLIGILNEFEKEGRDNLKKKNGLNFKYNLIFIGRLIESKEPDVLIIIYENIKEKLDNNIGIHFIGDGVLKKKLEDYVMSKNYNKNFFFHGALYDEKRIGELLYCCDLMVLPGECGLSIVHSFSFACPVVTYKSEENGPYHGPEIEYLLDRKTGFLVQKDKTAQMSEVILSYLKDDKLQSVMRKNVKDYVLNELSLDKMVEGIRKCIDFCLKD
ncbi:MAG: glycosyltransferase family 4 protein [Spirochaetes bacterium]|nr:glycosyltransferase family 4 protein [Spirochaetota bacterium]